MNGASATGLLVHELVEAAGQASPDRVAVWSRGAEHTYRALEHRVRRLANHLRRLGVGPGVPVGVHLPRSFDLIACVLGVLRAGGVYVPLDPGYPRERLAFMARDAGLRAVLSLSSLPPIETSATHVVVAVDRIDEEATAMGEGSNSGVSERDLAYILYTSGSSGRPKGVEVEHRALSNFLHSMALEPGLERHDLMAAVTTLCFDIAALELFLPLTRGARILLVDDDTARDAQRLRALLEAHDVTVMQATPATWRMLLGTGWRGSSNLKVLCGGEPLTRELATRLMDCGSSLWNLYGPTETTIWSTVHRVERGEGRVPVGRPIAGTRVHVVDEHARPVRPGALGELVIGGVGVARGYRNQPLRTASCFTPDAFGRGEGERLYWTGDIARVRDDGRLEVVGRTDHQVKVRGFRIELEEVETVLLSVPKVERAVVVTREDEASERRLVAYVVAEKGTSPTVSELREAASRLLPVYMLPSTYVFLEMLPLTPNAKIDRAALPSPRPFRTDPGTAFVAPRTATEVALARIWSEVLCVQPVGVQDPFLALGGHSLSAARIIARIASAYGVPMDLRAFLRVSTVAEQAAWLDARTDDPMAVDRPIPRAARRRRRSNNPSNQ